MRLKCEQMLGDINVELRQINEHLKKILGSYAIDDSRSTDDVVHASLDRIDEIIEDYEEGKNE